jgi:hypothetical protein
LNVRQQRIAFDFTPEELLASSLRCSYCLLIFEGIRQFQREIGDFVGSVSRIYACGPAHNVPRTLSLEIYFKEPRTKLEIEFHTQGDVGMSNEPLIMLRLSSSLTKLYSGTSDNTALKTNLSTKQSNESRELVMGSVTYQ